MSFQSEIDRVHGTPKVLITLFVLSVVAIVLYSVFRAIRDDMTTSVSNQSVETTDITYPPSSEDEEIVEKLSELSSLQGETTINMLPPEEITEKLSELNKVQNNDVPKSLTSEEITKRLEELRVRK